LVSTAVHKHHLIEPLPNQEPLLFCKRIAQICKKESIDLLIPTCEESFWVSRGKETINQESPNTIVFVDDVDKLRLLHSKWEFNQLLAKAGFSTCKTERFETTQCLIDYIEELLSNHEASPADLKLSVVFKPSFSRFGTQTIVRPTVRELTQFKRTLKAEQKYTNKTRRSHQTEWVAQEFIEGDLICTYSVVKDGVVLAHAAYRGGDYTNSGHQHGGSIAFKKIKSTVATLVEEWVRTFVHLHSSTGQISFDLILSGDGHLYAIECNPRGTSGIHLFEHCQVEYTNTFFKINVDPASQPVKPKETDGDGQITLAMLVWATFLPHSIRSWKRLILWSQDVWRSRDVIFEWWDPLPLFVQVYLAIEPFYKSYKYGIAYADTFTYDIEWHGE
ncbi:hypothetical protein AKO1_009443, partial [Acrasis kona]